MIINETLSFREQYDQIKAAVRADMRMVNDPTVQAWIEKNVALINADTKLALTVASIKSVAAIPFEGADYAIHILEGWITNSVKLDANPSRMAQVQKVVDALHAITNDTDAIVLEDN
jgi:hypothetical protein